MMDVSLDHAYASIIDALGDQSRILIAIAGPPGAGKSTLSAQLCSKLIDSGHEAAIVPMDGFHLDNAVLRKRGLLRRKGAPETFDVDGFISLARTLRAGSTAVAVPHFDRDADEVREAAETIDVDCEVVLFEGNYLLLDRPPWQRLHTLFDLSVFVKAPGPVLRQRLVQRWLDLGHDRQYAEQRAMENDIPNATLVLEHSVSADLTLFYSNSGFDGIGKS